MKIYLMTQKENCGYDTYDSCVVVAKNKREARRMHPSSYVTHIKNKKWMGIYSEIAPNPGGEYKTENDCGATWVFFEDIDKINIKLIGDATSEMKKGFVCASFNAG